MGEALYRKYRPQRLTDVVGQKHITTTLTNAIKNNKISHGYLFAGPRGVGKTSIARILAYQINEFDYGDANGSLDIIEIDGASNRRIDEIRELREKVHIAPVAGKYKIYIIDEVHMLTREAFNALLKTLEEPPAHVIFILATTEIHKLPETITSRTQNFIFKAVPEPAVSKHLKELAKKENIKISDSAIKIIANHGGGSFRDSISVLDQLQSLNNISTEDVREILGLSSSELIDSIKDSILSNNLNALMTIFEDISTTGLNSSTIAHQLIDSLKLTASTKSSKRLIELCIKLLDTKNSKDPSRYLELTLIDFILASSTPSSQVAIQGPSLIAQKADDVKYSEKELPSQDVNLKESDQHQPSATSKSLSSQMTEDEVQEKSNALKKDNTKKSKNENLQEGPKSIANEQTVKKGSGAKNYSADQIWQAILNKLKSKYNTLYGIARMAKPTVKGNTLTLSVAYPFHKVKLSEEKNFTIINKAIKELFSTTYAIDIQVAPKTSQKTKDQPTIKEELQEIEIADTDEPSNNPLDAITNIFGGGEVLEQ